MVGWQCTTMYCTFEEHDEEWGNRINMKDVFGRWNENFVYNMLYVKHI